MSDTGSGTHRATIQDAAKRLGVSESAIRKRITRGTLRYEKDELNGRMYVFLDGVSDASDTHSQDTSDTVQDGDKSGLVAAKDETIGEMRDRISSLERQLDARTEELRRRDIIISQLTSRIPELEATSSSGFSPGESTSQQTQESTTPEPPEDPQAHRETSPEGDTGEETVGAGTEPHSAATESASVQKRPWWRRMFGG